MHFAVGVLQGRMVQHRTIYIYIWYPKKELCSPHCCWYLQYLVSIFGGLLHLGFLGYHIYIYIVQVGYITCLSRDFKFRHVK